MRFRSQPLGSIRTLAAVLMLAVLGFGPSATAQAGYIASNLTSAQSFNSSSGYNLTGPTSASGQGFEVAARFTSATTVSFDSAQLALAYRSGGNSLSVAIMTESVLPNMPGVPSGLALETIQLTNISANPGLVTASSALHPILAAGVNYWLVATYGASDTNIAWFVNSTGATGQLAYRSDTATTQGPWNYYAAGSTPAFSISGSTIVAAAVDGPSSGFLVGIGGLGLLTGSWMQRRRPNQPISLV